MIGACRPGWVLLALALLLGGCSVTGWLRPRGVYHTIRSGETLFRISRTYRVELEEVVKANHIGDAHRIVAGTRLFIPGASRVLAVRAVRRRARKRRISEPNIARRTERKQEPARSSPPLGPTAKVSVPAEVDFIWPVKGRVSSYFGKRGKRKHQGIDIAAATGVPIRATEDGLVIFSDQGPGGYGLMVILRHPNGFHTIYAHNHENRVQKGQRVRQGDVIAFVGSTGRSTGPHLHFEIRNNTRAKDPLFYLP